MTKSRKIVNFNLNSNKIFYTYSCEEYDRFPIDYILLRKYCNKISELEWTNNRNDLIKYKYCEMIVHKDSI